MITPVTKNEIKPKRMMRKWSLVYEPLKIPGLVLMMVSTFLLGSFASAAPPTLRITIGTFSPHYFPKLVHIRTGTPISWENRTSTLHSITHDECTTGQRCAFDSGPIGPNQTFRIDHLPPGSYPYHCTFHPIMRGILVVLESDLSSES